MPHYHRKCLICATPFVYHPAGKDKGKEHVRGLCCSKECKAAWVRAEKVCPVYAGYCKRCGTAFVGKKARSYCAPSCHASANRAAPLAQRTCGACGEAYTAFPTGGRRSAYCSQECKASATAAIKRTEKAKRKAVLRKAYVEKVDPFVVFERDRWICQLCFEPTPKEKRGTHDERAPELDHIVALTAGGAHSYANTQCACRDCNNAKGNRKDFVPETIKELLG